MHATLLNAEKDTEGVARSNVTPGITCLTSSVNMKCKEKPSPPETKLPWILYMGYLNGRESPIPFLYAPLV
jgi:hypothetical protein